MGFKPSFNERLYFAAQEGERREALRRKLEDASNKLAQQRAISDTLQVDDQQLAERIQALGFDGDSARVFDLLPLIHVSWADGKVQHNERATILAVLEARGIRPGSEGCLLVETLLEREPSRSFWDASLKLLRDLLAQRSEGAESVVDLCVRVAEASGGLLGVGNKISSDERELISQIAELLGPEANAEFTRRLSK